MGYSKSYLCWMLCQVGAQISVLLLTNCMIWACFLTSAALFPRKWEVNLLPLWWGYLLMEPSANGAVDGLARTLSTTCRCWCLTIIVLPKLSIYSHMGEINWARSPFSDSLNSSSPSLEAIGWNRWNWILKWTPTEELLGGKQKEIDQQGSD